MTESAKTMIVIGGGPGGYVAAIRAAQLGARVTLIENRALGGTCLNRGCVPTKFLIQAADMLWLAQRAERWGIRCAPATVDFSALLGRQKTLVQQLTGGIGYLMKKNRIEVIHGTADLLPGKQVRVTADADPPIVLKADAIILASGSQPVLPPIAGADGKGVITSDGALALQQFPSAITIIGGGVIGIEFAQIFHRFGTRTTVIEMMPHCLPGEDTEISTLVASLLTDAAIELHTGSKVLSIEDGPDQTKIVNFDTSQGPRQAVSPLVLMAVGRRPNTEGLAPAAVSLALTPQGGIAVDEGLQTNIPGVFAIGDVLGRIMLAHVAMAEGLCAAENALGHPRVMQYTTVPRCVYTSPEVASVGLTEAQAKEKYGALTIGRFPFSANSKAQIGPESAGLVKIVAEAKYGQVVGVGIVGPHATELIAQAAMAMTLEATLDEFAATITAHPTLSEAVTEAALQALGIGLHC